MEKNYKRVVASLLALSIGTCLYMGSRRSNKSIVNNVTNREPESGSVIVATLDREYSSDYILRKLDEYYYKSNKNYVDILESEDKNSLLYVSALYEKLKLSGIKDSDIIRELDNIVTYGIVPFDVDASDWYRLFGGLNGTVLVDDNVVDYYYPLAKFYHLEDCSLEHTSVDSRITCSNIESKLEDNYAYLNYPDYIIDLIDSMDDELLQFDLERAFSTDSSRFKVMEELRVVGMGFNETYLRSKCKVLGKTLCKGELITEVYGDLGKFVNEAFNEVNSNAPVFMDGVKKYIYQK